MSATTDTSPHHSSAAAELARAAAPRSILADPAFRRFWIAKLLSETGTQLSRVALVLALAQGTSPVQAVAWLVLCETLPASGAAFLSGTIVDRVDKRRLMIAVDVIRAALIGSAAQYPARSVIYVVVAAESIGAAFFNPARSALLPRVVEKTRLADANSMDQASSTFVMIAAPLLGAELFLWSGLRATLLLDAASFLLSAVFIHGVRSRPGIAEYASAGEESYWAAAGRGWRFISTDSITRRLLALTTISLLCVGLWMPVAPVFIRDFLNSPAPVLGIQLSLFGVGGLAGSLIASPLAARFGKGLVVTMALFGEAVVMLVYSLVPWAVISGAVIFLWGAIVSTMVVSFNALLQEHIPQQFLGRVFAVSQQLESMATVLAVLLASSLARVLPAREIFVAASLVYLVLILVCACTSGGRTLARTV
jgi:MFS family permease